MTTSTAAVPRPQSAGPIHPMPPQPVLDASVVLPMGQGVVAAYDSFNGKTVPAVSGWTQKDTLTVWVPQKGGASEMFGIWYLADGDASTAMLALRGTVTAADVRADEEYATTSFVPFNGATLSPVPQVHGGFWSIYTGVGGSVTQSMQAQVFAWLKANNIQKLYLTGHSLGGGLAELMALDLAVSQSSLSVTTVTFAAPKAGLTDSWGKAYAQYVTTPVTVRVVNQYDVVPTLPPAVRYGQVGEEFSMLFYNTLGDTSTQEATIRHEMDNYLSVLTQALSVPPQQPQIYVGTFPDGVYTDSSGNPLTDTSAAPTADNIASAKASAQALPPQPVAQPPRRQVAVK
ncbi:lipase family protein [Corallococcus sp. CA053C]|uniref:lipase family protein n=1 Tax=Corallococcus sp. CA053C TaxID=2316732 RepID=UPI000EA03BF4|nr:lipase family protein [Corallococcus sp. CA053C]RKH08376.1 lipase family protein [Corallococcus sp. CA053C]